MALLSVLVFCSAAQGVRAYSTPAGYDEHDYQKLVAFLELPNGVGKNGNKISVNYDPQDPTTWEGVGWDSGADKRICSINWEEKGLVGELNVSGCTALQRLWCYSNQMTALDVSSCTALDMLLCFSNQLTVLNVSGCTLLTHLSCYYNQLAALDVSSCTALTELRCFSNKLTALDVSSCTDLQLFWCYTNQLSTLDVSGCAALSYLICSSNQLTALDVSGCTALEILHCNVNLLTALDVSSCTLLSDFWCFLNQLAVLDMSGCTNLGVFRCFSNRLTALDVGSCTFLTELICFSNQLNTLDVSDLTALEYLDCATNQLNALDVNGCTNLAVLRCFSNQLIALDVSGCTNLSMLWSFSNRLTVLDVGSCTFLTELVCHSNRLSTLDVSDLTALEYLDCATNQLTVLDVNNCTSLARLSCHTNRLIFSKLPVFIGDEYYYHSQAEVQIGSEGKAVVGNEIDLSSEATVNGVETIYTWYNNDGSEIEPTTSANGVFTFGRGFGEQPVYSQMTNATFPELTLTTNRILLIGPVMPEIAAQPQSITVASGATATFSVTASATDADEGGVLSYQWQLSTDGGNSWNNIDGATVERYTTAAVAFTENGYEYRCTVTNTKDEITATVFSNPAILGVVALPTITSQPQNTVVAEGTNATFNVVVETADIGIGGILSYQWQLSTDGGSGWSDIGGANASSYTSTAVTFTGSGYQYRCSATNTKDGITASVISDAAILSVVASPTIISQPQNTTILEEATATFSVTAEAADSGIGGILSYQWQLSTNGGSIWNNIDGSTFNSHTTPAVAFANNGDQYRCQVTNTREGVSATFFSNPAILSVVANPIIINQPQNTTVPEGAIATFSVTAEAADSGAGGILSYQWQLSTNGGSSWSDIGGANASSYAATAVTFAGSGYQYRCTVTNTKDNITASVISNAAILSVVSSPTITSQPQNATILEGATATFSVTVEAADSGAGGVLSYQWQLSTDGGSSWSDIVGAVENNYITATSAFTDNGRQYRCMITNTKDGITAIVFSNVATLSVVAIPTITSQPQSTTIPEGIVAAFSLAAETADSGIGGVLSYQWQLSTDGGSEWSNIVGATSNSHTTPTVTFANNGYQYRCQVINTREGVSATSFSNSAILSVVAGPTITSQPQNATVLEGATATFSITAEAADSGIGGVLSYQWQLSTNGGSVWSDVDGATANSYTTAPVTSANNGFQYRCKVTNTKNAVAAEVFSAAATLTVKAHGITFIKPTAANDVNNPVNINSGSLVLAQISGEIADVATVTIKIDDGAEQDIAISGTTIFYLLPVNLADGWHTITIKLTNTTGYEIEATVTFYWDSYRRGFGFGRFDFGEADDH